MLFKVYAQCCKREKPIEQIYSLDDGIWENIYYFMDAGKLGNSDDENVVDREISEAWASLKAYFDKNGFLDCGDYQIVKADSIKDIKRPNMCGYTSL